MGSTLRILLGLTFTGCFWQGVGQPAADDPATYEAFFRQVASFPTSKDGPSPSTAVLLNGVPVQSAVRTVQPPMKDAIGLTEQEVQILNAVVSDLESKLRAFQEESRPVVFEARLQLINSEDDPRARQQLRDVENGHAQIVGAHVQQVKTAFGEERFKVLDTFVHSKKPGAQYFPAAPVQIELPKQLP